MVPAWRVGRWRQILAATALLVLFLLAAAVWRTGVIAVPRDTGYLAPVFAPDGNSVFVIRREVRALVVGLGAEFFTAPARVRLFRDRFALLQVRLPDLHLTLVEAFPPSPLEGERIRAYHGAIFGVPHAHLRWADGDHLEYEIAVTRHDVPTSRTFVVRKAWDRQARAYVASAPWAEGVATMSGDEPGQLHGNDEVVAVPGDEAMPCGIALLRTSSDTAAAAWVLDGGACDRRYARVSLLDVIRERSRRADILRAERISTTYDTLIERARRAGRNDGQARLEAGKEMQRLGLFPKTTTIVAEGTVCEQMEPVFAITDTEFAVGLFPDIEQAISTPGAEVDKSMGDYITHRDYRTSREINDYLNAGHSTFAVRARGACWRLTVKRP